jgi:hypothetical protein
MMTVGVAGVVARVFDSDDVSNVIDVTRRVVLWTVTKV